MEKLIHVVDKFRIDDYTKNMLNERAKRLRIKQKRAVPIYEIYREALHALAKKEEIFQKIHGRNKKK